MTTAQPVTLPELRKGPERPHDEAINQQRQQLVRRARLRVIVAIGIVVLLIVTVVVAIGVGQYATSLGQIWQVIESALDGDTSSRTSRVLLTIRLPRIVLGLLVGAALGTAGALLQALFANPLADPGVIGVSSGAALGASISLAAGWTFFGHSTLAVMAIVGGVGTTLVLYRLARGAGHMQTIALLLLGIAMNAMAGAAIAIVIFLSPSTTRDQIVFWQMGSLNGATWSSVVIVVVLVVAGLIQAMRLTRRLDTLALGERAAWHSGVDVRRLRMSCVLTAAVLTAAAVSFAGIIAFVGLVVPHAIRLTIGPGNRWLVPLSAAGGAWLVSVADIASRNLITGMDVPIGVFTALVGAPAFFVLLRHSLYRRGSL